METEKLVGERRTAIGTRVTRALRKTGRIPVVIYGHGEAPESISLDLHDLTVSLAHGARTLEVKVGGKGGQYLIKEVQYDHMDQTPIHVDLTRVNLDERVKVRVGIQPRGVPKGIADGGVLDMHIADIEVECLVTEIPETLHPILTHLELGDSLTVKDLELPDGVTVLADPEERIATVRAMMEAPEVEEVAAEGEAAEAEPERIGRVRTDEDEKKDKASS